MHCCVECFTSPYLKNIINSDSLKGNCDFCNSNNVSIYSAQRLIPFFRNILNIYEVAETGGLDLVSAINVDFGESIFSSKVNNKKRLLKAIFTNEIDDYIDLLEKNIKNISFVEQTEEIQNTWEKFKEEIKSINRFHIKNTIDLDKLESFFNNESFLNTIFTGQIYYRCRISTKSGFDIDNMGNPPIEKVTAGRANPNGVSYLYLSDQELTSIYEVRAALYDYVTVGKFELLKDIKILNLREPIEDPISWSEQEAIEDYLIYIPFIKTLQNELSLPIRRLDTEIDYLPTQYLSEFIKSIGFDGVEYKSSLYSQGYNLAIFSPENFMCKAVNIYEIKNINLEHKPIG